MNALDRVWPEVADRLRAHTPASEAGVREVIAQTAREVLGLDAAGVAVEASHGQKRLDVLVREPPAVIELKYHRPIQSGRNRPMTVQFGQILADIRELATVSDGSLRYQVLVTDSAGVTHLENKATLPLSPGGRREIRAAYIRSLAQSAAGPATADGEWIDVSVRLEHRSRRISPEGFDLLVWEVRLSEPVEVE